MSAHIDVTENRRQSSLCTVCEGVATHALTAHQGDDAIELPVCETHGVRLSQVFQL